MKAASKDKHSNSGIILLKRKAFVDNLCLKGGKQTFFLIKGQKSHSPVHIMGMLKDNLHAGLVFII